MKKTVLFILALAIGMQMACSPVVEDDGVLRIVTTTGIIADCVKEIVGDQAEVTSIMGPGVDPHVYKASQGDLEALSKADIIIYNGLHLEGKMNEVFEKLSKSKTTLSLGSFAPKTALKRVSEKSELHDPHIWFNPDIWLTCLEGLVDTLKTMEHFEGLDLSFEAYQEKAFNTKAKLMGLLNDSLPESKRVLITSHDAFSYFGDAFKFEVRGLQGISTAAEFGVKDVSDLISYIEVKEVKAIFVETSVSDKNLQAVVDGARARGYQVEIGGRLYSDALGEANTPAGTYLGMLEANVNTIVNGLK